MKNYPFNKISGGINSSVSNNHTQQLKEWRKKNRGKHALWYGTIGKQNQLRLYHHLHGGGHVWTTQIANEKGEVVH